jgi:hypothetical protein
MTEGQADGEAERQQQQRQQQLAGDLTGDALLHAAVQPVPLPYQLGARVEHFFLEEASGTVSEVISGQLGIPQARRASQHILCPSFERFGV